MKQRTIDEISAMEERAKAAEQALVGLTPDGSEFYRRNPDRDAKDEYIVDVPACVAHVRDRLDRMRESVVAARRQVNRLRWPVVDGTGPSNPVEDGVPVASLGEPS